MVFTCFHQTTGSRNWAFPRDIRSKTTESSASDDFCPSVDLRSSQDRNGAEVTRWNGSELGGSSVSAQGADHPIITMIHINILRDDKHIIAYLSNPANLSINISYICLSVCLSIHLPFLSFPILSYPILSFPILSYPIDLSIYICMHTCEKYDILTLHGKIWVTTEKEQRDRTSCESKSQWPCPGKLEVPEGSIRPMQGVRGCPQKSGFGRYSLPLV